MADSSTYDSLSDVKEKLAAEAGLTIDAIREDPINDTSWKKVYNSIMRRPNTETIVSRNLFDDIVSNVVQDKAFLFNPSDFGRSDHYDLTNFLTSRLKSKFSAFQEWIFHDSFPSDIEIVSFPSSQPYAYMYKHEGRHLIVIHYGLTQLLEFTAETVVLQDWIKQLKKKDGLFAAGFPLIEKQLNMYFINKMALGTYAQKKPLLLPGLATALSLPCLLELVSCVAFAELFVCAHEHVHISQGHFGRVVPDEHSHHGRLGNHDIELTDDQRLELATDLLAFPYLTSRGWTGALNGVAIYFLALGQYNVMYASPSRSHPPILHRINNLLSETVAIGPASMFPVRLYYAMQAIEKMEKQQMDREKLENIADWPALIAEYTNLTKKLALLLVMSELSQNR